MYEENREAICIDIQSASEEAIAPPLKLNETYQIHNKLECSCGNLMVDVGIKHKGFFSKKETTCTNCGRIFKSAIWWCNMKRFALIDYAKAKLVEFKKLVKSFPVHSN